MTRQLCALLAIPFLGVMAFAQAQTWKVDPAHSSAMFTVTYQNVPVSGSFSKVSGTVKYDPKNPQSTAVDVTIDARSLSMSDKKFDSIFRTPAYLDVGKYPNITFKSSSAHVSGQGNLLIQGNLTIRGKTLVVSVPVAASSIPATSSQGSKEFEAGGSFAIKRTDYGVGTKMDTDILANDVMLAFKIGLSGSAPAPSK